MTTLTSEQEAFLEECSLEFSERYTISDPEFKKMFESEIPSPPILYPWYGRSRFNNRDRERGGNSHDRSSFNRSSEGEYRDRRRGDYKHDGRDSNSGGRYGGKNHSYENRGDRSESYSNSRDDRRYRPY